MKPIAKRRERVKAKGRFDYPSKQIGPTSEHVGVWLDSTLLTSGLTLANSVQALAETVFRNVAALFPQVAIPGVNLIIADMTGENAGSGGAYHYGCAGTDLYVDADLVHQDARDRVLALFVAELVEVAESSQKNGWDCGASAGEGLSRFVSEYFYPGALDDYSTAATWLDGLRPDWVTSSKATDEDDEANGCSVLFLFWLFSLGFDARKLCAGPGAALATLYKALTRKDSAWTDFSTACETRWPSGRKTAVVTDNPWSLPLPIAPDPSHPPAGATVPEPIPSTPTEPAPTDTPCIVIPQSLPGGHYVLVPHASVVAITAAGVSFQGALDLLLNVIQIAAAYGTPLATAVRMLANIFTSMGKHLPSPADQVIPPLDASKPSLPTTEGTVSPPKKSGS